MYADTLGLLLKKARLLIFDFDGTLADTSVLHARAFESVMSAHGVPVHYPSIAGMKTVDAVRSCLQGSGVILDADTIEDLARAKQSRARAAIAEELAALPGVDAFLQWARSRFRLALCTSGSRLTVELSLRKLGYEGMFDPVVCADDVQRAKPDPEGYLLVLEIVGCNAGDALAFEDSSSGVAAARRAGIPVICVDASVAGADATANWAVLSEARMGEAQ
jgi:HAD superfamily hydrolase (TIGR01509 family)